MRLSLSCLLLPVAAAFLGVTALGACSAQPEPLGFVWPPTEGMQYPDLELQDSHGETVLLSSFRGRVLLIEPIGMT